MKTKIQILLCLALVALLTGCNNAPTQEQIDADIATHISEFSYKGHQYILYESDGVNSRFGGITHSPDCPCHANKTIPDSVTTH